MNKHLDVLLILHHKLRDLQPQFLPQLLIVLRLVRIDLRQLQVPLL